MKCSSPPQAVGCKAHRRCRSLQAGARKRGGAALSHPSFPPEAEQLPQEPSPSSTGHAQQGRVFSALLIALPGTTWIGRDLHQWGCSALQTARPAFNSIAEVIWSITQKPGRVQSLGSTMSGEGATFQLGESAVPALSDWVDVSPPPPQKKDLLAPLLVCYNREACLRHSVSVFASVSPLKPQP